MKPGDIVTTIKVGDIGSHHGILCEIIKMADGKFTLETPHGTTLELSISWVAKNWRPMNKNEQKRYDFLRADSDKINQQFGIRPRLEKQQIAS